MRYRLTARLLSAFVAAALPAVAFVSPAHSANSPTPAGFTYEQLLVAMLAQGDLPGYRYRPPMQEPDDTSWTIGAPSCHHLYDTIYFPDTTAVAGRTRIFDVVNHSHGIQATVTVRELRSTAKAIADIAPAKTGFATCGTMTKHVPISGRPTALYTQKVQSVAVGRIGDETVAGQVSWAQGKTRMFQNFVFVRIGHLVIEVERDSTKAAESPAAAAFARLAAGKAAKALLHRSVPGGVVPRPHGVILPTADQLSYFLLADDEIKGVRADTSDGSSGTGTDSTSSVTSDDIACRQLFGDEPFSSPAPKAVVATGESFTGPTATPAVTQHFSVYSSIAAATSAYDAFDGLFAACHSFAMVEDGAALTATVTSSAAARVADAQDAYSVAYSDGIVTEISLIRVGNVVARLFVGGRDAGADATMGTTLRENTANDLYWMQNRLGN